MAATNYLLRKNILNHGNANSANSIGIQNLGARGVMLQENMIENFAIPVEGAEVLTSGSSPGPRTGGGMAEGR
jgi:hypothetical protein